MSCSINISMTLQNEVFSTVTRFFPANIFFNAFNSVLHLKTYTEDVFAALKPRYKLIYGAK